MNQAITNIIELLFRDVAKSEETEALREELLNNCQERFEDLLSHGYSEEEAVAAVTQSLAGMKEVLDEYPKKPTPRPETDDPLDRVFPAGEIDSLRVDVGLVDVILEPSADEMLHVFCNEPGLVTCEQDGRTLRVRANEESLNPGHKFQSFTDGSGFDLSKLLGQIANALRSISSASKYVVRVCAPEGSLRATDINTRSGDITLNGALARQMAFRSASGDVEIFAQGVVESLNAGTSSGDIIFRGEAESAVFNTISGDLRFEGRCAKACMKSVSGDAKITGGATELTCACVSGDLELDLTDDAAKHIALSCTSGDIDVRLPPQADSVHLVYQTRSGDARIRVNDAGPNAKLTIEASTVSGDITIE